MKSEFYDPKYFDEIHTWFKHYDLDISAEFLPTTGLIVPGYACGFLYLTNSPQAYIEGLCKNPHINSNETNLALDLVINDLFNLAKENGAKLVTSITRFDAVVKRAINFGCEVDKHSYKFLGKYLG